jgi:predicted phage-related endonuclease
MKTLVQVQELLAKFEGKFGLRVEGAQQQSEAWFWVKLGVLSASNASKIVAKKDSETRKTYLCELAAQVCTGEHKILSAAALDWGNQNEDAARAYYELVTGFHITPLPFVFKDDNFREGCSPDAFVTNNRGCEIKCPFDSTNFIKFAAFEDIKPEWKWQMQYTLRVTGAEVWDFCEFDPRIKKNPLHRVTAERDEAMQRTFDDAVPQFIDDLDSVLSKMSVKHGDQWTRIAQDFS